MSNNQGIPSKSLEGNDPRDASLEQSEMNDDGILGSNLDLIGNPRDASPEDVDFSNIPRDVLILVGRLNNKIDTNQKNTDRKIDEINRGVKQLLNNPLGRSANRDGENNASQLSKSGTIVEVRDQHRKNQSGARVKNQSRIRLHREPSCSDDESDEEISTEQYRMAMKTLKMPVLKSVDQYNTFKIEFDDYLQDTNYPIPYMRKIYMQAMSEGCQEAKAFYSEMKRIGNHYSYRKLVQEADKHFGHQLSRESDLLRKLTTAYQAQNESLDNWYARIFKLQQDLLDRHSLAEANTFKRAAATQLVEGLYDEEMKEKIQTQQLFNHEQNRSKDIPNLKDLFTHIKRMHEISFGKTAGRQNSRLRQEATEIGVNFARVQNNSTNVGRPRPQDSQSREDILHHILNTIDSRIDEKFNQFIPNVDSYGNLTRNAYQNSNKRSGRNNFSNRHAYQNQSQGQNDNNRQQYPMPPYHNSTQHHAMPSFQNNPRQYPSQFAPTNTVTPGPNAHAGAYTMHQGSLPNAPQAQAYYHDSNTNTNSLSTAAAQTAQTAQQSPQPRPGVQSEPTVSATPGTCQPSSGGQVPPYATPCPTPQPNMVPNYGYGPFNQPALLHPNYLYYQYAPYPPAYNHSEQRRQGNDRRRT